MTHSNAQGFTLCPFVLWLAKRNAHSCHSMHVHAPRTAPQKKSCQVPPNSHAPLLYMQMFTDAYLNNQWELCLACQWLLYLLMLVFLPLADDDNDWLILDCMPCCLKQQQQITFSITALYRREEARGKGLALLA